jgi:hypothetical protein
LFAGRYVLNYGLNSVSGYWNDCCDRKGVRRHRGRYCTKRDSECRGFFFAFAADLTTVPSFNRTLGTSVRTRNLYIKQKTNVLLHLLHLLIFLLPFPLAFSSSFSSSFSTFPSHGPSPPLLSLIFIIFLLLLYLLPHMLLFQFRSRSQYTG